MSIFRNALAAAVVYAFSCDALAEEVNPFTRADASAFATAVRSGDINTLAATTDAGCNSIFRSAHRPDKKVAERAKASADWLACLKVLKGTGMGATQDLAQRAAVEQFFAPQIEAAEKVNKQDDSEIDFMGYNWGVGFGYSIGEDDAVDDAQIVNGIVRVNSERKNQPRALLEFHKYFWCNKDGTDGTRGCGPFIAVAATEEKILSGVGIGLMYGRKSKAEDSDGFSIGVGLLLDDKVKDLADGFEANEPPPEGETSVRYLEKARWSLLIFATRTF